MIRDVHPGSWFFTHPGSRIQRSKRYRIPDPQHYFSKRFSWPYMILLYVFFAFRMMLHTGVTQQACYIKILFHDCSITKEIENLMFFVIFWKNIVSSMKGKLVINPFWDAAFGHDNICAILNVPGQFVSDTICPWILSEYRNVCFYVTTQLQCFRSGSESKSGSVGSGSISQRFGFGSGSFYHQAKIIRKTWIPTALWLLLTFYLSKRM